MKKKKYLQEEYYVNQEGRQEAIIAVIQEKLNHESAYLAVPVTAW